MKKNGHTYHVNPVPFSMVIANPKGKKRGKLKRRNPSKKKAGIYVIRKPRKNPAKSKLSAPVMKTKHRKRHSKVKRNPALGAGVSGGGPIVRKAGAKRWHHKKGTFRYNPPGKKRRRAKRRNPAKLEHVLLLNSPMSKKRTRRGKRGHAKNPMSRRGAPRRSGRRSSLRFRNPVPAIVSELFGPDMLSLAGGVVMGNVGTNLIMNRMLMDPATGQRPFDLPGVNYAKLANPATAGQFYSDNAWILAFYKVGIGGLAGYLLRNASPRLSRGILIGTTATAVSDVLKNTGVITPNGTVAIMNRGAGAFLPSRGTGTYIPGVPPMLSGPATAFLNNGAPVSPAMARRGMGASVNRRWANATVSNVPNPFPK